MTVFYLNLHECGVTTAAYEPSEFADLAAARQGAVAAARDIMAEEVRAGRLCLSCHIAIDDSEHREVARVLFREAIAVSGL